MYWSFLVTKVYKVFSGNYDPQDLPEAQSVKKSPVLMLKNSHFHYFYVQSIFGVQRPQSFYKGVSPAQNVVHQFFIPILKTFILIKFFRYLFLAKGHKVLYNGLFGQTKECPQHKML